MKKLLLSLALLLPFAPAKADLFKYSFNFSGPNKFNTGTETLTGTFTLDQTALFAVTPYVDGSGLSWYQVFEAAVPNIVTAWSGTVSGSNGYNGPLPLSYITLFRAVGTGIDANQSLVGQAGLSDFGFFGWRSNTVNDFQVTFNGFSSNTFDNRLGTDGAILTGSIVSAVPEPSSWVLGLGGLMGMTVLASRKKKTTGSILKAPALLA